MELTGDQLLALFAGTMLSFMESIQLFLDSLSGT